MITLKKLWFRYKNLFLYQFAIGYNAIINLLAIIVFTRLMSAKDLGIYFYIIAIINFLSIITAFGFQQGILRYNPGRKSRKEKNLLFRYASFLSIVVTILFFLVLITSFMNLIDIEIKFLILIYIGLIVDSIYKITLSFYQAHKQVNEYKVATIIASNFRWIFGFFLVYFFEFNYLGLIASFILGEFICILIFTRNESSIVGFKVNRFELSKIKLYMQYGIPLIGYSLITFFKPLLINFWLKINEGEAAIGIFNANFIMGLNVIGLLTTPLLLYMQPILVEKFSQSQKHFFIQMNFFFRLFTFSSIIILFAYIIFQEKIIEILIGKDFRSGGVLILFGLFSAALNGLILILIKPFEMWKKTGSIMNLNLLNFGVFMFLGFIFHKYFSLGGIAYSYIISNLFTAIYLLFYFKNELKFDSLVKIDLIWLLFSISVSVFVINYFELEYSFQILQIGGGAFLLIYLLINFKNLKKIWMEQKRY